MKQVVPLIQCSQKKGLFVENTDKLRSLSRGKGGDDILSKLKITIFFINKLFPRGPPYLMPPATESHKRLRGA